MSKHARIAQVQSRQLGVVSHRQVSEFGITRDVARREIAVGRMVRLRRGVYAAAAVPPSYEQSVLGAVLAIGDNTFASHLTAAVLWGLPVGDRECRGIEVTTLLEKRPRVAGVRVHRSGLLAERDLRTVRSVPILSPERTIIDLSSRLGTHELGVLTDEALRRHLTTPGRIHDALDRLRRAPGRSPTKVRAMLGRRVPGVEDRESVLEDFVFDALRRFELPLPKPQHWVRFNGKRRRIDLCYVEELLALEACGFEFRRSRSRFDDEALRGNELVLLGYKVLEFTSAFTDRMIAEQVAAALRLPLRRPRAHPLTFDEWCARR